MKAIDLIKETVEFYSEDVSRRAVDDFGCSYESNGRNCAVGRCMKKDVVGLVHGNWVSLERPDGRISTKEERENLLEEKYRGFPDDFWMDLQTLHDLESHWTGSGISESGKEFADELMEQYKELENQKMNEYPFKITIDDGYCAYEYTMPTDGNVSIAEIARSIHAFLRVETPLKGEYVKGSGEMPVDKSAE